MNSKNAADALLAAARDLLPGDDAVWDGRRIIWKKPETWVPALTAWLAPAFRADSMRHLAPGMFRELTWDDGEWLDVLSRCVKGSIDDLARGLGDALLYSVMRTYHGCCTEDAGSYFSDGLLTHNRERLRARVAAIIEAHPEIHYHRAKLDRAMEKANNDHGKAYVVLSDAGLLKDSAHYLIHGSEWMMSLFDDRGRDILKCLGAPTLIEIDLPASMTHSATREHLAKVMLKEWTRLACNGHEWSAPIDFAFTLIRDVPPQYIVGHSHPATMSDPHDEMRTYRSPVTTCRYCASDPGN
jgi:hypothetical protein